MDFGRVGIRKEYIPARLCCSSHYNEPYKHKKHALSAIVSRLFHTIKLARTRKKKIGRKGNIEVRHFSSSLSNFDNCVLVFMQVNDVSVKRLRPRENNKFGDERKETKRISSSCLETKQEEQTKERERERKRLGKCHPMQLIKYNL